MRRICFFFNAQRHQLLHGVSTAVALARRPGFEVHIVSLAQGHVDYARDLVARLGGAPIVFTCPASRVLDAARRRTGRSVPPKLLGLAVLAPWLNRFDAIALPERTSTILKTLGVRHPRFIHLDHGAGDRAAGFDRRIRRFDFVLTAGEKTRARLADAGLIRTGAHAVVGYPKFEAADAARTPGWSPFDGTRPIVLYNPHFSVLGSWEAMAADVLAAFAAQDRYDLIVAPHVRLLDGARARARWDALLARHEGDPHIHVDRGSDRSIDMTYTMLADIYLGDVSSQVYEFLRVPRPCLFLDARGIAWAGDPNYAHWHYGPVLRGTDDLIGAIDAAVAGHGAFGAAQAAGFTATFGPCPDGASSRAAAAIGDWLTTQAPRPPRRMDPRPAAPVARRSLPQRARRAAMLLPALIGGWLAHDLAGPLTAPALAESFVDEALESHQAMLVREGMRSQPETGDYDPAEIRRATRIAMPRLPAGWHVRDVQIFPGDSGVSVQLVVRTPAGEPVLLVAMRMDTPAGRTPLLDDRGGRRVAYWEDGACAFALVGGLPAARLLSLAAGLATRSS